MNLREHREALENELMSPYAARSTETRGRVRPEEKCDIRTEYQRDRDRILHCKAFRRMKHKTQVFISAEGDHYRTRLTHTLEVSQIARTIARALRLNEDLTEAIALGHDLGHTPFGHSGEKVLNDLYDGGFEHCAQSIRVVERLEKDGQGLNLTWEVKNGILNHRTAGHPATLEGKVVQLSDKIAYIGRDIEDALALGFLSRGQVRELEDMAQKSGALNTTVIIHELISDICANSSPREGIRLSDEALKKLNAIKAFNTKNIYANPRFKSYQDYAALVMGSLFNVLMLLYAPEYAVNNVVGAQKRYPLLCSSFSGWLAKLCSPEILPEGQLKELSARCKNVKVYADLSDKRTYAQAAIDFLAGMTDKFAVKVYGELLTF